MKVHEWLNENPESRVKDGVLYVRFGSVAAEVPVQEITKLETNIVETQDCIVKRKQSK